VTFAVISTIVGIFAAILSLYRPALFRPYFGQPHPLLVFAAAIIAASICLAWLSSHTRFQLLSPAHDPFWPVAVTLVPTLLTVPAIAADALIGFPRDMNVSAPESLLFYPAIGYIAEVTFRLLPLTLFLFTLTVPLRVPATGRMIWTAVLFAAAAEPIFQVAFSLNRHPLTFLEGFVAAHVFIFGVAAGWVFLRYDFATMYLFRLVYYLWWHIVWGTLRLHLLF